MKTNPFNLCPTCIHVTTCVLTKQKHKVWSCSEYDDLTSLRAYRKLNHGVLKGPVRLHVK